MFVQTELHLQTALALSAITIMLLAKSSLSNVFSFILYHRRFTVRRGPVRYPGYTSGITTPHGLSRARMSEIVWPATGNLKWQPNGFSVKL